MFFFIAPQNNLHVGMLVIIFATAFQLVATLTIAASAKSDVDFVGIQDGRALFESGTLDVVVGLHFGVPRQKCADICRSLGDDSCTGFTTSPITRACILFRRAISDPRRSQQEFYLKRITQDNNDMIQPQIDPLAHARAKQKQTSVQEEFAGLGNRKSGVVGPVSFAAPTTTQPISSLTPAGDLSMIKTAPSKVVEGYTEFSVNCLGGTISGHKHVGSVGECAKYCNAISDCLGISYSATMQDCFLKSTRDCPHPTGESSPFKFYRKDGSREGPGKKFIDGDEQRRLDEEEAAQEVGDDSLNGVGADSYSETADEVDMTTTPTTPLPLPPTRVAKPTKPSLPGRPGRTRPPRRGVIAGALRRTSATTTTRATTTEAPTTTLQQQQPGDDQISYLYTPLSGNCPENTIGDLLPLQYPHCAKLCDSHPDCQGFAYTATGPACFLKSAPCHEPVVSQYTFYSKVWKK